MQELIISLDHTLLTDIHCIITVQLIYVRSQKEDSGPLPHTVALEIVAHKSSFQQSTYKKRYTVTYYIFAPTNYRKQTMFKCLGYYILGKFSPVTD